MFVVNLNRTHLYKIVSMVFRSRNEPVKMAAEIGVLRGDNATEIYETLLPEQFWLVDAWSTTSAAEYASQNKHRWWVDDPSAHANYYGGKLDDPKTFEDLYSQVKRRFTEVPGVRILRCNSLEGAQKIKLECKDKQLSYLYIDANHSFEAAFDDLMVYSELLEPEGVIQMNDVAHSQASVKQNCGVLEATVKFIKCGNFVPLILTNQDMADCLLVRKDSNILHQISSIVRSSDIKYVEVPHSMLGGARIYKYGKVENVSFSD